MTEKKCEKCKGVGQYMYDENHMKPCEVCCTHSQGWWKLEDNYGDDNGKYPQITKLHHPLILHPHQILTVCGDSTVSHVAT